MDWVGPKSIGSVHILGFSMGCVGSSLVLSNGSGRVMCRLLAAAVNLVVGCVKGLK